MKDIGSLGNNENFFDGFKISKSSVNNIAYLATALDLIKDSLDGFGPEARNALLSLEFIAKNTKILQQVKAPDKAANLLVSRRSRLQWRIQFGMLGNRRS